MPRTRPNFARQIEEMLGQEKIEAVVIGRRANDYSFWTENPPKPPPTPISWKTARQRLDYDYDDGFGGAACHAIAVYTSTRIILVSQYDGSTSLFEVQRHPVAHWPPMPGGG